MAVLVGRAAPSVAVEAYVRGEQYPRKNSLSDYRGQWVVLYFYPRDFTFVCPTEIQSFGDLAEKFKEEDASVLGDSTDSYHVHKAWYETDGRLQHVDFPIIADASHHLSEAFDVLEDDGAALRGTYIIDPEGVVKHLAVNPSEVGRNVEESLRTLQALKTGALCPANWKPGQGTLS